MNREDSINQVDLLWEIDLALSKANRYTIPALIVTSILVALITAVAGLLEEYFATVQVIRWSVVVFFAGVYLTLLFTSMFIRNRIKKLREDF